MIMPHVLDFANRSAREGTEKFLVKFAEKPNEISDIEIRNQIENFRMIITNLSHLAECCENYDDLKSQAEIFRKYCIACEKMIDQIIKFRRAACQEHITKMRDCLKKRWFKNS